MVARLRPQRSFERDRHTELANVVQAVRHYAARMSQQEIAATMNVSTSTVSRWMKLADEEGILQIQAVPPPMFRLEEKLKDMLRGKNVETVSVVPNGPDKNIESLGLAGANQVMHAILSLVEQNPARENITIALSCGTTVSAVIENLIGLLAQRQGEGNQIRQTLEIYPTVLFGDSELHPVYPHTIVAYFAMLGRNAQLSASGGAALISGHAFQLPAGFYEKPADMRNEFKQAWGLNAFIEDILNADIFVLGAGNLTNSSYGRISKQLHIEGYVDKVKKGDSGIVQILYAPLRENGLPDKEVSDKIVGVTVEDMQNIARDHTKRVILVAGGSEKIKAMQRVIRFPCYNVLVTDVGVAAEAIQQHSSK
jgi:DNA-binding transcriptional regulator LsrR (DeoR family)